MYTRCASVLLWHTCLARGIALSVQYLYGHTHRNFQLTCIFVQTLSRDWTSLWHASQMKGCYQDQAFLALHLPQLLHSTPWRASTHSIPTVSLPT